MNFENADNNTTSEHRLLPRVKPVFAILVPYKRKLLTSLSKRRIIFGIFLAVFRETLLNIGKMMKMEKIVLALCLIMTTTNNALGEFDSIIQHKFNFMIILIS